MTKVVELYGGPGVGKSTLAAKLFVAMKESGISVELVSEYAKEWAWENRPIGTFDQVYILAKQLKREMRLYGKVDCIITDSPLTLGAFYSEYYDAIRGSDLVKSIIEKTPVQRIPILLKRSTHTYQQDGRFESESQALEIDAALALYLKKWRPEYIESELNLDLVMSKIAAFFGRA